MKDFVELEVNAILCGWASVSIFGLLKPFKLLRLHLCASTILSPECWQGVVRPQFRVRSSGTRLCIHNALPAALARFCASTFFCQHSGHAFVRPQLPARSAGKSLCLHNVSKSLPALLARNATYSCVLSLAFLHLDKSKLQSKISLCQKVLKHYSWFPEE